MRKIINYLLWGIISISTPLFAGSKGCASWRDIACCDCADELPWAVALYGGTLTESTLGQVLTFNYHFGNETLYSFEVSRQLARNNPFRQFLQPIVSTVEIVGNATYRDDPVGSIYEVNPYIAFRWRNFPWNRYLKTSFALGEGISYDSKVPEIEAKYSTQTQGLLNFLLMEATFASPKHPQLEFLARVHHRSGMFGLYDAGNSGSTAAGLGVRYRF